MSDQTTENRIPLPFTGVNLAGGEFYKPLPGVRPVHGENFFYPTNDEIDYFASKGMNVIRVPFLWETLQPVPFAPFDDIETARFKAVIDYAASKGLTVIIDPHNYARYYGEIIGGPIVSTAAFADFWARLAKAFMDEHLVWFGLVNEPHDMSNDIWLADANAAIAAIRSAGATNLILVPGNGWSAACDWTTNGNDVTMLGVVDPLGHWIFEPHTYLDCDNSGTHDEVVSTAIGVERLADYTLWCREHCFQAFLGEFAVPVNPIGRDAIDTMLSFMEANRDVWLGFTWWAAGPRWGDYMFTLEPKDGVDSPLLAFLEGHLKS